MLRIIITYILPLALPTVLYFIWTSWVRKQVRANRAKARSDATTDHTEPEEFDIKAPWFRLILAGVTLVAIGLVLSVFLGPKNAPDAVYQAPRMENNTIIPGQYVPKPN